MNQTPSTSSTVLRTVCATVIAFFGTVILRGVIEAALIEAMNPSLGDDGAFTVAIAVAIVISCSVVGLVIGGLFRLGWPLALTVSVVTSLLILVIGHIVTVQRQVSVQLLPQLGWTVLSGAVLFGGSLAGAWFRARISAPRRTPYAERPDPF